MSSILHNVAPSFISVSYIEQAEEMRKSLQEYGATFTVSEEQTEDAFLVLLPQLIEQFPLYFKKCGSESAVESAFFSLVSMIQLLSQVEQIEDMSKSLSNAIAADETNRFPLKGRLLGHQLNCYHTSLTSSYTLLTNVLKLVKLSGQVRYFNLDITQISDWLAQWKSDVGEQRDLFRLLHEAFTALGNGEKAIKALVHLLKLYGENEGVEAKADAHICVISHIAQPNIFIMDHLLDLHPIKALDGQLIHELLQIFVSGDLNDYLDFYSANTDFVEHLSVSHEQNKRKLRLLTLASICEGAEEIEFSKLADRLNLEKDEIEPFIIEAIGSGLVKGKINEPEGRFTVSTSINRCFGQSQWSVIKDRLELWQKNLQVVRESLSKGGHLMMPIGS